jgi:hypothetical protein
VVSYDSLDAPLEHCDACVHPTLGKPMRAMIGGGLSMRSRWTDD